MIKDQRNTKYLVFESFNKLGIRGAKAACASGVSYYIVVLVVDVTPQTINSSTKNHEDVVKAFLHLNEWAT